MPQSEEIVTGENLELRRTNASGAPLNSPPAAKRKGPEETPGHRGVPLLKDQFRRELQLSRRARVTIRETSGVNDPE
jgi:hypothetical protein